MYEKVELTPTEDKHNLSNKGIYSQKISLKEGEELVTDDVKVAVQNKHFVNSVRCLAEKGGCSAHLLDINDKKDALANIIARFKHQRSILAIL